MSISTLTFLKKDCQPHSEVLAVEDFGEFSYIALWGHRTFFGSGDWTESRSTNSRYRMADVLFDATVQKLLPSR